VARHTTAAFGTRAGEARPRRPTIAAIEQTHHQVLGVNAENPSPVFEAGVKREGGALFLQEGRASLSSHYLLEKQVTKKKSGPKRGRSSTSNITIKAERKIVELYGDFYGAKAIVKHMNQNGYRAPAGGSWSKTTVVKILQANGVYHEGRRVRDEQEKFWSKTRKGDNDCILWTGAPTKKGYGRFTHNGIARLAHVAAWQFRHGPTADGTHLHHVCRHTNCVNHVHLSPVPGAVAHARLHKLENEHLAYVSSDAYVAEMLGLRGDAVLAACR
jgi:hypothetical protein